MPHLVVEYTDNLEPGAEIPALLAALAENLCHSGVFPPGGVRVRALRLADYVVGDGGHDDAAFVHVTVKIGAGRPASVRETLFAHLFEIIKGHFARRFEQGPLALSMYVEEVDEAGSFKHNNLHALYAGEKGR